MNEEDSSGVSSTELFPNLFFWSWQILLTAKLLPEAVLRNIMVEETMMG